LSWPGGVGLGPWSVLLSRLRSTLPSANFGALVWLLRKKKKDIYFVVFSTGPSFDKKFTGL